MRDENNNGNGELVNKAASVGDLVGLHQSLLTEMRNFIPQIPAIFPTNDVMPIPSASYVLRTPAGTPTTDCHVTFDINGAYSHFTVVPQSLTSIQFAASFGSSQVKIVDDTKFPVPVDNTYIAAYAVNFFPIIPGKIYSCENKTALTISSFTGSLNPAIISFYK